MKFLKKLFISTAILMFALPILCSAQTDSLTVTAVNKLSFGRLNQTIELSARQLEPLGKNIDLDKIHVKDAAGKELLCQAIDTSGNYQPDEVIFQADFAPNQMRHFYIYLGKRHLYTKDQFKAYGRFVRERFDDFAWENNRIADRTYGQALKNWKGGPLTSSAIDVWCKKVNKLVVNNWYMTGHVETDTGQGADLYRAGDSRGVGGDGLWANGKLWTAENYTKSRVFGKGPIRVMFRLNYNPFSMRGDSVDEVKRVALDAGQNLNHFTITYSSKSRSLNNLVAGIGIEKTNLTAKEVRKGIQPGQPMERSPGALTQKDVNAKQGWMTTQQPLSEGMLNCAIIVNPKDFVKTTTDKENQLLLAKVPANHKISYWAGFYWSKSGQFKNYKAWKTYIRHFAKGLQSPIQVTVSDQ